MPGNVNLSVFSDAREAISGVISDLSKIKKISEERRKEYLSVIDETMSLLDAALLLVIHRLGEVLDIKDDNEFVNVLQRISDADDWMQMERSISLCMNLREAKSRLGSTLEKLVKKLVLSKAKAKAVDEALFKMLNAERELAEKISESVYGLSQAALDAPLPDGPKTLRKKTRQARELFKKERKKLIQDQVEMMNILW